MKHLNLKELTLICRESEKTGMECVGEVEGDKVYRVTYRQTSYYTDESCTRIYTVYDNDFYHYDEEILDLGASTALKHLLMIKESL